jgi:hypothetical protein
MRLIIQKVYQLMDTNYKVWNVDARLLGHEIVIASSNNTAVENISKEIPRLAEVDKNYGLEYFSKIATYVNNEECWGIGSAVLGNKINRSIFLTNFGVSILVKMEIMSLIIITG